MATMYEYYKYINAPTFEHTPYDVLSNRYQNIESLIGKLVVSQYPNGYRVYPTRNEFLRDLDQMPESERVFHEVIFNIPQKLKFDIDAAFDDVDAFVIPSYDNFRNEITNDYEYQQILDATNCLITREEKYTNILDTIIDAIETAFLAYFAEQYPDTCKILCESLPATTKFSNHIIIDGYYVDDSRQAKEFTRHVASMLPDVYRRFLDQGVNKSIQCFRAIDCHKSNDLRTKKVLSKHSRDQVFITNIENCKRLPNLVEADDISVAHDDMNPHDVQQILELCNSDMEFEDHKFRQVKGNTIIFNRVRPSFCAFCQDEHTSDNTLMVTIYNDCGSLTAWKYCWKQQKQPRDKKYIGTIYSSIAPISVQASASLDLREWIDTVITKTLSRGQLYNPQTLFDDLPATTKHIYCEKALRDFEPTATLVVHAAMKMGKTKALHSYIERHFPNNSIHHPIIRFISFRQTFSNAIKENFPDFVLYSDIKGPLSESKLIIQVESLHRLDIRAGADQPDLLILDECESIIEQFDSGLLKQRFNDCFAKFQYLLKYSKHVICMDAGITNRTFRVLRRMRPGFGMPDNGIVYHHNTYQNAKEDIYYLTGEKVKWLGLLHNSVEAGEKIAVPMSSLTEAKALVTHLMVKFPTLRIKLYSSETIMSEKQQHFGDVNEYWGRLDVLVYTPTVSAGVSFEKKHFDKLFGYFTDMSCPVETCMQMIGRIRDVGDKCSYICLSATGNNLPDEPDLIKNALYSKRQNLMKKFDDTGLSFEYNENGEMIYHDTDYFQVWIENTVIRNKSRNSFVRKFIHCLSITGASVQFLSDEIFENSTGTPMIIDDNINFDLIKIDTAHSDARNNNKQTMYNNIANAPDIDDDEVAIIQDLIITQQDVMPAQRYAYEKYRMRVDYRYSGKIDSVFVKIYHDYKIRRIYRNLNRVYSYDSIPDLIAQLQDEERLHHSYLMSLDESSQNYDINRKYVFDQHRYALSYLKLAGWSSLTDVHTQHINMLLHNLQVDLYWDNIDAACHEFMVKSPNREYIKKIPDNIAIAKYLLRPINKILGIMYAARIMSKKHTPDMFSISIKPLFTLDEHQSEQQSVPLLMPIPKTEPYVDP